MRNIITEKSDWDKCFWWSDLTLWTFQMAESNSGNINNTRNIRCLSLLIFFKNWFSDFNSDQPEASTALFLLINVPLTSLSSEHFQPEASEKLQILSYGIKKVFLIYESEKYFSLSCRNNKKHFSLFSLRNICKYFLSKNLQTVHHVVSCS